MAIQGVLARGDRRLAAVLLDLPQLSVAAFWEAMARHGLTRDEFLGARDPMEVPPWAVVDSGVSDTFFRYEWRLAARAQIGPHCPPDSAGCLTCGACDEAWAFRFREGVPSRRTTAPVSDATPIPLLV
jgi:hypothetical protein